MSIVCCRRKMWKKHKGKQRNCCVLRNMEKLTSRKNPLIRHLRLLGTDSAYRREAGEYVLDGVKLLQEAMRFGAEIGTVLWAENSAFEVPGAKVYSAPKDLVEYASPLKNAPGPVFTVAIRERTLPAQAQRVIVLENVQDPGNVGTVIRTANAMGMDAVILTGNCAGAYGAKTARAAMGALFRQCVVEMTQAEAVEWLHRQGFRVYGAALSDRAVDVRCVSLDKSAFVVGSEGQGLSSEMLNLCDGEVIIPMQPDSESLNAGVAASILMWELAR